ncbi:MAG: hypothetical protein IKJ80_00585 [Clostridia bacterium]|nr:hypothetical protein [Clostridia bacterium]
MIRSKLAKLIDVKSIMTLMLTVVFCVLAGLGVISGEQFVTIFTVIVGFYFGTQSGKKEGAAGADNTARTATEGAKRPYNAPADAAPTASPSASADGDKIA